MNFELLNGVVGILIGLLIIIFRSKYVSLQKWQASKRKTSWSKQILEKDSSEMEQTSLIIGFGFIVLGLAMAANAYGVF